MFNNGVVYNLSKFLVIDYIDCYVLIIIFFKNDIIL